MGLNILIVVMCVLAFGGAIMAWTSDNGSKEDYKENSDSNKNEK